MRSEGAHAVMDLLDAPSTAAALGAALELRLFWRIAERPFSAEAIAEQLGVRPAPCVYWLQILAQAGFLDATPDGFRVSTFALDAIVNTYEPDTWALLAEEARERLPALLDLPRALRTPAAVLTRPDYVDQMRANPDRARRFTRMLYDLHRASAERLASQLDMAGVQRLLDVGGGSGVFSFALADRHPGLTAIVVDIAPVCDAGGEIARERGLQDRVTYQAADVTADPLPQGFDLALVCDLGVYAVPIFRRIADALRPGGRVVIVDVFPPAADQAPRARAHWAFERALVGKEPDATATEVERMLLEAGFELGPRGSAPPEDREPAAVLTGQRRASP